MSLKQLIMSTVLVCNMVLAFTDENECNPQPNPDNISYIGPGHQGMFASINSVLHDLLWCEKNNKIPVVFWDDRSNYYKPGGFNGSDNVWEYYFQPVAHVNPRPKDVVPRPSWERIGRFWDQDIIDQEARNNAQRLIDKYIRFNPIVQIKIDAFYQTYMEGKKTVGIHLRGTDKEIEVKLVSPEEIVAIALEAADKDAQFLIASDEKGRFEEMKELLKKHNRTVIFYDCYRAESKKPLHLDSSRDRCVLGEDVLIEAKLLSKCDLFVHTMSCVSTGVLYFNASLKHIRVGETWQIKNGRIYFTRPLRR